MAQLLVFEHGPIFLRAENQRQKRKRITRSIRDRVARKEKTSPAVEAMRVGKESRHRERIQTETSRIER